MIESCLTQRMNNHFYCSFYSYLNNLIWSTWNLLTILFNTISQYRLQYISSCMFYCLLFSSKNEQSSVLHLFPCVVKSMLLFQAKTSETVECKWECIQSYSAVCHRSLFIANSSCWWKPNIRSSHQYNTVAKVWNTTYPLVWCSCFYQYSYHGLVK